MKVKTSDSRSRPPRKKGLNRVLHLCGDRYSVQYDYRLLPFGASTLNTDVSLTTTSFITLIESSNLWGFPLRTSGNHRQVRFLASPDRHISHFFVSMFHPNSRLKSQYPPNQDQKPRPKTKTKSPRPRPPPKPTPYLSSSSLIYPTDHPNPVPPRLPRLKAHVKTPASLPTPIP
ncbi:uncharacterized protein EAE98_000397 [Botrytis deweyae]|uniref:Uncharacterized protein n=1 Tax=Botrytis deweyae TaxID=2478750 RepID=A0ABQ7J2L4_9HELO|nr:uncharacterized protein EAE98_000397 [Botrytis deweyae]KAF7940270.1 hypothetical protein EAE98_000397 [Botrytis deweyae]